MGFSRWELADQLTTPELVAEYMNQVTEDGDPSELAYALGVAARAKGMSRVARDAGVSREGLYTTLGEGGNPTLSTFSKVLAACGVQMRFTPAPRRDLAAV